MTFTDLAVYAAVILAFSAFAAYQLVRWANRFRKHHPALCGFVAGVTVERWRNRPAARPPVLEGDDMWAACTLTKWGKTDRDPSACRVCNGPLPERRRQFCGPACKDWARENHWFDAARSAARKRDGYRCVKCGSGQNLEVDHVVACLGAHKTPGCWHHLDGLRTLCGGGGKSCHQKHTNSQRRAGEFDRGRRAS